MNSRACSPSRHGAVALAQVLALGPLPLALAILQDWYVDVNAPGCSMGTGTQVDPFCDIMDAVSAAADGDTVHIAPGTYFENVVLEKDLDLIGTGGQEVTILDGSASGSVVYVVDSAVTLTGLTLTNGTGTLNYYYSLPRGGGLFAYSSVGGDSLPRVRLTSCTVRGNSAYSGGGLACGSGGSDVFVSDGTLELVDCAVVGNSATDAGGGIFGSRRHDPWTHQGSRSFVTMTNSTVSGNTAEYGGGIAGANLYLRNSSVAENQAGVGGMYLGAGGGIHAYGQAVLVNSTVHRNTVASGVGGGISTNNCSLSLTNSTVTENEAYSVGGIAAYNYSYVAITNLTLSNNTDTSGFVGGLAAGNGFVTNSVLSSNAPASLYLLAPSYLSVDYSLVDGGWPGTGNIDADPLFSDPLNGDYRLGPRSPCIDAGSNAAVPSGIVTDLDGKPRFLDDLLMPDTGVGPEPVVDMGAFEVSHPMRVRRR